MSDPVSFNAAVFLLSATVHGLAAGKNPPSGESEQARHGRSLQLLVQPIAASVGIAQSANNGLIAAYFINYKLLIEATHFIGTSTTREPRFDLSGETNELRLKWFWGSNSFYYYGGLATERYRVTEKSTGTRRRVETYGFVAGFGNQWQWSRMTLGIDWFGNYVPATKEAFSGESGPHEPKSYQELKTALRSWGFHTGRFYIGASW